MSNGRYSLPSGREVYLCRLYLDHTYSGQLEGTPESLTPFILRGLRDSVRRIMSPGKPLVINEPGAVPLPGFRIVAELESKRAVKTNDCEYASFLFVCWFTDDIAKGMDELLKPVLETLDWDANAEDYNWADI